MSIFKELAPASTVRLVGIATSFFLMTPLCWGLEAIGIHPPVIYHITDIGFMMLVAPFSSAALAHARYGKRTHRLYPNVDMPLFARCITITSFQVVGLLLLAMLMWEAFDALVASGNISKIDIGDLVAYIIGGILWLCFLIPIRSKLRLRS